MELANPRKLAGIFGDVAWGNKERLPEPSLLNLIDTFNRLKLNPQEVPNDLLGAAYEYLLRQFADESGKKAGEFFTPRAVVRLLVKLLDPRPKETIYDPACGSGGMLVETIDEVREHGGDVRTLRLFGQEVNLTTSAIARMNLYLHDIEEFQIVRGDTLRDPRHLDHSGELTKFDVVIANPPFILPNWGAEQWANDPWQRAFCGVPPQSNADLAWVQHMVASMSPGSGRVGVVMPHGALFREEVELEIRRCLLQRDVVTAVIGLPPNIFYNTTMEASILLLNANKPSHRVGKVRIVDASACFEKTRTRNTIANGQILELVAATMADEDIDDGVIVARTVPLAEIESKRWAIRLDAFLEGAAEPILDPAAAMQELGMSLTSLAHAEARVKEILAVMADIADG